MMYRILLFLLWLFIWSLLLWPPTLKYIVTGVFVSLFVSFITVDIFSPLYLADKKTGGRSADIGKFPVRLLWFLWYAVVFLWECVKANIDVAWRVLHPAVPIRPGTIRVRTKLKSDIGLTFLANSITLTPGTTTVDIDKPNGFIYVHVLSLKDGYEKEENRQFIVDRFERILVRIFE